MAIIRQAYVAKEGFASLMGVLMAQGTASAESKILSLDRFPDSSESYAGIYDLPMLPVFKIWCYFMGQTWRNR